MVHTYRTENLLSIENVGLNIDGKQILKNINIKIDNLHRDSCTTGQVVAFLGKSGSGKSSLLKIMAGLWQPTEGNVYITPKHIPVTAGAVGMVMQDNRLFRHRTVLENLTIAAQQNGADIKTAKEKSLAMLEKLGIQDTYKLYPSSLSGGMKQRVAICQQLLCSEHYLLFDEPFAALDPVNVKKACNLITEIANQDEIACHIIVTHSISSALAIADTLWIMGKSEDGIGYTVTKTYDLIERGLCWSDDIYSNPNFYETEREIRELFNTL